MPVVWLISPYRIRKGQGGGRWVVADPALGGPQASGYPKVEDSFDLNLTQETMGQGMAEAEAGVGVGVGVGSVKGVNRRDRGKERVRWHYYNNHCRDGT